MPSIQEKTGFTAVPNKYAEQGDELTRQIHAALDQLEPYLATGELYHQGALQRILFPFSQSDGFLAFDGTRSNPCTLTVTGTTPVSYLRLVQLSGSTLVETCSLAESLERGYVRPEHLYSTDLARLQKLYSRLQFACLATSPLDPAVPWG